MQMLKKRLEEKSANQAKTLWFNAWRYEGREEAQAALIHAVLGKLSEDKSALQKFKDTFQRLKEGTSVLKLAKAIGKSAITLTPDFDGLVDAFKLESEKIADTMESFDQDFEQLLQGMGVERIVVFIDDLDRCSSAKVIETFETIKLFLNTPACTFVIGADAAKIQQAVGEIFNVSDKVRQKDFLEKIVQIPFAIPEQNITDIVCYVGMLIIGKHLDEPGRDELSKARATFYQSSIGVHAALAKWPSDNRALFGSDFSEISTELNDILPHVDSLARGLKGNPRQIKRFLNIQAIRQRLAKANGLKIRQDLLVKLGVVEYSWEDFWSALADTVDPFTGRSELIEEVLKTSKAHTPSDSALVTDVINQPGLLEYLSAAPQITGDIDLGPYLFLAQTSLIHDRVSSIAPTDEKVKSLARSIGSDDPLRSRSAAKQAASEGAVVAAAVVRMLSSDLQTAKDAAIGTRILNGMTVICRGHKDQYPPCIKVLSGMSIATNDAVSLAANTLFNEAEKAGVQVSEELKEKFKGSKLVQALAAKPKKRNVN
jgi:uncharacterized glyoxalase superfamily protein PhnB